MELKDQVNALLDERGAEAVIDFLTQHKDAPEAVRAFNDAGLHAYNQHKDLALLIRLHQAGIQYGLKQAETSDEALKYRILSEVKGIHYNLGSNTWPGWDDEGISITPEQMAIGSESAKANLQYAIDLDKGDMRISRAHWLVAAHKMAAGDLEAARESFGQALASAQQSDLPDDQLLNQGFIYVTDILLDHNDAKAAEGLEEVQVAISEREHGAFLGGQFKTALRVFGKKEGR